MKIICFGDSITGSGRGGWTDDVAAALGDEYEVTNRGVGGNTTQDALGRIEADVLELSPSVVLIEFGVNDCYVFADAQTGRVEAGQYQRNLREIVRLIAEANARPILIINHEPRRMEEQHQQGNGKTLQENLRAYNALARELARELSLATIDITAQLHEAEADAMLADDGIHLSQQGQAIYGRIVAHALRSHLKNSNKQAVIHPEVPAERDLPFSMGVVCDGWLYVSGQAAVDFDTMQVVRGSVEAETRLTMHHVEAILKAAGCTLDDVVKCTCHLADINDFDAFNRTYREFFPGFKPARTTVQSVLWNGIKIEIDAIARIPQK